MSLPFEGSGKRFYPYFFYLKNKYGGRIAKVPLDGGFTCPNRDGTKGVGGCSYCSASGSGDFIAVPKLSIEEQFAQYRDTMLQKWEPVGYIPYFQSFTGTYASMERLRSLYMQAISLPQTVGLSIATRPDCIHEELCCLLMEIADKVDLTIELGVQTVFDETAEICNMCHTYADFEHAVSLLHTLPVEICVHLMNGLPGETHDMMVQSAAMVGQMGIHAVKLHSLHILKHTPLAQTDYSCLTMEEYVSVICDQLEVLPPHIVIQRLTGDGKGTDLIAPDWSRNKRAVLAAIDREMKRRDHIQGCRASVSNRQD